MKNKLGLISLTALIVAAGATSAQAHAVDGVGAGFLHLVTSLDHVLVLLAAGVIAGFAVRKGLKAQRARRSGTD
ncbi:MAG: HupE/UreJ family protein [Alphaproteobacteria bacterium]